MVWQFGYQGVLGGRLILHTGGLGALEFAFAVLGWPDPYPVDDTSGCALADCSAWGTAVTTWPGDQSGLMLRLCSEHYHDSRRGAWTTRPPLKAWALAEGH